jgi:hypothetical protein
MLALAPRRIYPAHGPVIADGCAKIREYIAHRHAREGQILAALAQGDAEIATIVKRVYTDVPEVLHAAAAHSVAAHLGKLEREGRAPRRRGLGASMAELPPTLRSHDARRAAGELSAPTPASRGRRLVVGAERAPQVRICPLAPARRGERERPSLRPTRPGSARGSGFRAPRRPRRRERDPARCSLTT